MNTKKLLAFGLAGVMLLGSTACSKAKPVKKQEGFGDETKYTTGYDETKYNAPGEFPIFKTKTIITAQLPSNGYVEDFNTNYQTLLLEKNLNADLQIEELPSKEYYTKINLMAAAGGDDFADAVMGKFSDTAIYNYANSDVIIPVTSYYYNKDIAYYLNVQRDAMGWNLFKHVTMPDGEIYGIAGVNETISNVNADKMWVYGPWLEKLGVNEKDIKTRDDFKDVLAKIKTTDLNGNGKQDEVALTAPSGGKEWFRFIMNTFVYAGDKNYFNVTDGELSFAYQSDKWKEGLKFLKGMYDEGIIGSEIFSQDNEGYKGLLNADTVVVGAFGAIGPGWVRGGDSRRVDYIGIAPLVNDDGIQLASYTAPAAITRFVISKNAKNPESVFRFGDYMVSDEISINNRWGEKGVDYIPAQEGDKSMYDAIGYKALFKEVLQWSTLQNKLWEQTGPYIVRKPISAGVVWSGNPIDHNRTIAEAQIKYEGKNPEEYVTKLIYTPEEEEVAVDGLTNLNTYVTEMTASFITGEKDIDKNWNEFQDQIEAIGSEEILIACQAAYDRMNDK